MESTTLIVVGVNFNFKSSIRMSHSSVKHWENATSKSPTSAGGNVLPLLLFPMVLSAYNKAWIIVSAHEFRDPNSYYICFKFPNACCCTTA